MQLVPVSDVDCSALSANTHRVSAQTPRASTTACTKKKKKKGKKGSQALAAKPLFGHWKFRHTLVEMGSAALSGMLCLNQVK